jgi:hypothetical protein
MATVRPSADYGAAGSWTASTGSVLFQMIDESSVDLADYIESPVSGATAKIFDLSAEVPTLSNQLIDVSLVCSVGTTQVRLSLLNGATNNSVGDSAWQTITTTPTTYSLSVTTTGAATRVQIEIQPLGGGTIISGVGLGDALLTFDDMDVTLT